MPIKDFIPSSPSDFNTAGYGDDNVMNTIVDVFSDDFKDTLASLAARNMKPGKFLGAGKIGIAYELETLDGQKIDSAVIRFDPESAIDAVDNPVAIKPVFQVKNDSFAATVVPRGEKREFSPEEIKTSLEAFNTEGQLPNLLDMKPDQFMAIKGIDAPVLADLSSMRAEVKEGSWSGSAQELCDMVGLDYQAIKQSKASPETMARLRAQRDTVDMAVRRELSQKGINLDDVPSKQNVTSLEPAMEQSRGTARG